MNAPAKAGHAVDTVGRAAVTLRDGRLTPEQIDLLKRTVAKGASDDEFALFLHICNKTGLDPFARQIYCLQRRTRDDEGNWVNAMVPQTGIDGIRLVAERTGKYRGQTAPVFYDAAGNERPVWLDPKKPPYACRVGVYKGDFQEPLYAIALYHEYVQKKRNGEPNAMWASKPSIMLAKCAEAMALRKAFPQELSGLYAEEELPDAEPDDTPRERLTAGTPVRVAQEQVTATEDGDAILHFGRFRGERLSKLPTSAILAMFRDPWAADPAREQLASERLGAGFVALVKGLIRDRQIPPDLTVRLATLMERRAAGEVLVDEDADELRLWQEEHPVSASTTA